MADQPIHFEMIDEEHARFIRRLSGAERLQIAFGMWDSARRMIRANVADMHPDWSQPRVDYEVAKRMMGSVTEDARLAFERYWQKKLAEESHGGSDGASAD